MRAGVALSDCFLPRPKILAGLMTCPPAPYCFSYSCRTPAERDIRGAFRVPRSAFSSRESGSALRSSSRGGGRRQNVVRLHGERSHRMSACAVETRRQSGARTRGSASTARARATRLLPRAPSLAPRRSRSCRSAPPVRAHVAWAMRVARTSASSRLALVGTNVLAD